MSIYCPHCDDDTIDEGACYLCGYENPIINDNLGHLKIKVPTRYTLAEVRNLYAEFLEAIDYGSTGETGWENFTRWVEARAKP